jgi:hypothetical protein
MKRQSRPVNGALLLEYQHCTQDEVAPRGKRTAPIETVALGF